MDLNGSIFDAINDLAGHVTIADNVMKFCAQYVIFAIVALVAGSWFVRSGDDRARRVAVYTAVLTALLSLLAVQVIQHFYVHQRPFVTRSDVTLLISHGKDASFPSEHAAVAFALAGGIAAYRLRFGVVLIVLATLVGFSRIYVGVHYPGDVVAGALLGISIAAAIRGARPMLEWLDRAVVLRIVPAALQ